MKLRRLLWISTLVGVALAALLELSDQEAYYWMWSQHPALCYFEHPPLQAWVTGLLTSVLGSGAWVIRLPAIVGRLLTLLFFFRYTKHRYGPQAARLGTLCLVSSFLFLGGSFLSLPDVMVFPFTMLVIESAEKRQAWRCGLYLGLAALGKWTAAMLVPGVLAAFWMKDKDGRRDLRGPFIAGALSLLLQSPVLYWNATHGWASFLFHLRDRHQHGALLSHQSLGNLGAFLFSQALLGGAGFVLAALMLWSGAKRLVEKNPRPGSIWAWVLPAFLVFGLSAVRGESRFYWTGLAFLPLAAELSAYLTTLAHDRRERFERWTVRLTYVSLALVALLLLTPAGIAVRPVAQALGKNYDLRFSPRGDFKGWNDWVHDQLLPQGKTPAQAPELVYYASDFRLAAQLSWTLRDPDPRRINVIHWPQFQYAFWPHPPTENHPPAIFFADNRHRADNFFDGYCQQALVWKSYTARLYGEPIKEIRWAYCPAFR